MTSPLFEVNVIDYVKKRVNREYLFKDTEDLYDIHVNKGFN